VCTAKIVADNGATAGGDPNIVTATTDQSSRIFFAGDAPANADLVEKTAGVTRDELSGLVDCAKGIQVVVAGYLGIGEDAKEGFVISRNQVAQEQVLSFQTWKLGV